MSDYIDREKLLEDVVTLHEPSFGWVDVVLKDNIEGIPSADVVPKEEYDLLEKRFRRLMESDYIAKFDMVDTSTKEYIKKISEADDIQRMYRHLEICLEKFGVPLWDNNCNMRKVPDILLDLNIAIDKLCNGTAHTTNVVSVVRCKDCAFRGISGDKPWCERNDIEGIGDNFFCADGIKKGE